MFDHERLIVYRKATEFLALAMAIADGVPTGHASLADQLRRAATSIPLNIAEASGKPNPKDRRRFHGIARGSAMECAAVLDVVRIIDGSREPDLQRGRDLLLEIVAMLTRMCR